MLIGSTGQMSTLKCPRTPSWKYLIGCWKQPSVVPERDLGWKSRVHWYTQFINKAMVVNEVSQKENTVIGESRRKCIKGNEEPVGVELKLSIRCYGRRQPQKRGTIKR